MKLKINETLMATNKDVEQGYIEGLKRLAITVDIEKLKFKLFYMLLVL